MRERAPLPPRRMRAWFIASGRRAQARRTAEDAQLAQSAASAGDNRKPGCLQYRFAISRDP
jgi:hypothetical protein